MARNVPTTCNDSRNTAVQYVQSLISKHANSAAVHVDIPHSEKPVAAGEEHVSCKGKDQEGQLLSQVSDNKAVNATNPVLHKLAVVLSQQIQQRIADEQAAQQGQESQPVPQNVNLQQYAQPASAAPLPMGVAQAQAQQMQAAMPGAAPQAAPQAAPPQAPAPAQKAATIQPIKPMYSANHPMMQARKQTRAKKPQHAQLAPVGNGNSPNSSPINSYSGLSATGDINGNAAFGTPNSAEKLSAAKAPNTPCSCGCGDTVKTCKCGPSCKCRKSGGSCYKGEKNAGVFSFFTRKLLPAAAQNQTPGAAAKVLSAVPRLNLSTASPAVAPALASARGIRLADHPALLQQVFSRAGNLPPARPPHLRPMAARSDAGGLRRFGDGMYSTMPAEQKARMGAAWDRWQQAAQTKARAAGALTQPESNPFTAHDIWSQALANKQSAASPAWQRSEGKNEEGGLNEKGRKSYEREHGGNLKAPVTEKNPTGKAKKRRHSFCSRMCGMKRVNTGASTAKDPDSRINKSLRKWNCKCSSAVQFGVYIGRLGQ